MTSRLYQRQPPHQKQPTLADDCAFHWLLNEATSTDFADDTGIAA